MVVHVCEHVLCVYKYIYVYIYYYDHHIYTHIHTYIHTYTHTLHYIMLISPMRVCVCIYRCIYICVFTYVYTYTHTFLYVYIYTLMFARAYRCTEVGLTDEGGCEGWCVEGPCVDETFPNPCSINDGLAPWMVPCSMVQIGHTATSAATQYSFNSIRFVQIRSMTGGRREELCPARDRSFGLILVESGRF